MRVEALVFETETEAARAAAGEITALLRARGPRGAVVGLCAGRTPAKVYAELVRLHREEGLSFAHARLFGLDELDDLPEGSPATFRAFLEEHLLDAVDVQRERVHLLPSASGDTCERACSAYEEAIRAAGGIDLQLLGIGANGHVAFNEPGSDARSRARRVELHEPSRRAQAARGAEVSHALTLGIGTILEARALRVLAFGPEKADVACECLHGEPRPAMPVTLLRGHPDARLIVDRAAAAVLARRGGGIDPGSGPKGIRGVA